MENRTKQALIVTAAGVTLLAALMNFSSILAFAGQIVNLVLPVIVGGILALFINVPVIGVEKRLKRLFSRWKKRPPDKLVTVISFVLTLICVILVLILALTLLIPELVRSCQSLYAQIEAAIPRWIEYLKNADIGWLRDWVSGFDWDKIMETFYKGFETIASNAVGAVSATANTIVTAAFALIISVYMSLEREMLRRHSVKLVRAYLKPAQADGILNFCRLFRQSFANFLTGQCAEAVILGILMALAFTIFRIPYGSLAGVVTAICALIPYVGAFISCCISVFLVFLIDPMLALRCLIVYNVVQFVENQFIYPRVVGGSVGLPPIYTLIAAIIGGKLFGIVGIIFFIPLAAVIIELVKENAEKRLGKPHNKGADKTEESQPPTTTASPVSPPAPTPHTEQTAADAVVEESTKQ